MGAVLANDIMTFTLWWIPVAVAFVVVIVAIGLLQNILVVARNIDDDVHLIWTVGKNIANTTVELWLLGKTVGLVRDIRNAVPHINDVAQTIAAHAAECRHCPRCVSPSFSVPTGGRGTATAPRTAPASSPAQANPSTASEESPPWAWRTVAGESKGDQG